MQKEIKYNGYTASPADYLSADGDMASMLNCIPERGVLKAILPPQEVKTFDKEVIAIHRISAEQSNYILRGTDNLYWQTTNTEEETITELFLNSISNSITSVTPIGNTLIALVDGTMHYFLWRENGYNYLGTQLPKIDAKAFLETYVLDLKLLKCFFQDDGLDFTDDSSQTKLTGGDGWLNAEKMKGFFNTSKTFRSFNDGTYKSARTNVHNRIFSVINRYKKVLSNKGMFFEPFYIRFAYRLYDGTYCRHTTPILMCPNSWGQPITTIKVTLEGTTTFDPKITASNLSIQIPLPTGLDNWKELITHIDVFATQPLINYADSEDSLLGISKLPFFIKNEGTGTLVTTQENQPLMTQLDKWENLSSLYNTDSRRLVTPVSYKGDKIINIRPFISKSGVEVYEGLYINVADTTDIVITDENGNEVELGEPQRYDFLPEGLYRAVSLYNNDNIIYPQIKIKASRDFVGYRVAFSGETSDIESVLHHNYIQLKRVDGKPYEEVLTEYNNFYKIAEFKLDDLVRDGGFYGNPDIRPSVLENITTYPTLPDTGQLNSLDAVSQCFSYNNRVNVIVESSSLPECTKLSTQNPAYDDTTESKEACDVYIKVVENGQVSYTSFQEETSLPKQVYFAYPHRGAQELILAYEDTIETIPLKQHPFLNLAYSFNMFNQIEGKLEVLTQTDYPEGNIRYGNKIKTSPVNNPFVFSEENTSELPVSEIYGISTAAQALSQGQFGQFPLYAFTSEGVWALEVTGTGTYSARQPISRDVCINPSSITQIDNSVLFATSRGIMLLSGSQTLCISDVLDGPIFDIEQLEFAHKTISDSGTSPTIIDWRTYLQHAQMLYDYPGQRIIVFNPSKEYSYVFSLESKQWGIMKSDIKSTPNSYPDAYAVTSDNTLVNYSAPAEGNVKVKGHFVTRPLKLDAPDVHKTITSIIQRGQFRKGNVNTMLYGSRDLERWYPVYASADHILRGMRGTPYKYFRLASVFELSADDNIQGCSVQFDTRDTNKMR